MNGAEGIGRGRRPMSEKHIALGRFYAATKRQGRTIGACMAEWNAAHPEWAYASVTNFGWDGLSAVRRMDKRRAEAEKRAAFWQAEVEKWRLDTADGRAATR